MSVAEWIDVLWMMLLEEGRGGMMDSQKYRKVLTEMFWYGRMPEETPEDKVERLKHEAQEAKESIGKRATPMSALEQMREMQDAIKARGTPSE